MLTALRRNAPDRSDAIVADLLADARRLSNLPDDRLVLFFRRTSGLFIELLLGAGQDPDSDIVRQWRDVGSALEPSGGPFVGPETAAVALIARECAIALALRSLCVAYENASSASGQRALRHIQLEARAAVLSAS